MRARNMENKGRRGEGVSLRDLTSLNSSALNISDQVSCKSHMTSLFPHCLHAVYEISFLFTHQILKWEKFLVHYVSKENRESFQ
jgi:hypothetical protein